LFYFLLSRPHLYLHSFPTRRSSDLIAFLQIVTFAGIYFKLGDLMAMFSLQSSDTQQVSRRIMRRPYMFLNRRARRLERKIGRTRSEEHTSELQSRFDLVCRLLLEKK